MNRNRVLLAVAGLLVSGLAACGGGGSQPGNSTTPPPSTFKETSPDASGTIETFSPTQVDKTNPFFTQLGTNNRTCNSCHMPATGGASLRSTCSSVSNPPRARTRYFAYGRRRQLPQRRRVYSFGCRRGLQPVAEFWADPHVVAGAGERRVQHHRDHRSLPVSGDYRHQRRRSTAGRFPPPT